MAGSGVLMLSSGCEFSFLHSGFISGPHGIPWKFQSLLHGVNMIAVALPLHLGFKHSGKEGGPSQVIQTKGSGLSLVWLAQLSQSLRLGGWVGLGHTSGAESNFGNTGAEIVKALDPSMKEKRWIFSLKKGRQLLGGEKGNVHLVVGFVPVCILVCAWVCVASST